MALVTAGYPSLQQVPHATDLNSGSTPTPVEQAVFKALIAEFRSQIEELKKESSRATRLQEIQRILSCPADAHYDVIGTTTNDPKERNSAVFVRLIKTNPRINNNSDDSRAATDRLMTAYQALGGQDQIFNMNAFGEDDGLPEPPRPEQESEFLARTYEEAREPLQALLNNTEDSAARNALVQVNKKIADRYGENSSEYFNTKIPIETYIIHFQHGQECYQRIIVNPNDQEAKKALDQVYDGLRLQTAAKGLPQVWFGDDDSMSVDTPTTSEHPAENVRPADRSSENVRTPETVPDGLARTSHNGLGIDMTLNNREVAGGILQAWRRCGNGHHLYIEKGGDDELKTAFMIPRHKTHISAEDMAKLTQELPQLGSQDNQTLKKMSQDDFTSWALISVGPYQRNYIAKTDYRIAPQTFIHFSHKTTNNHLFVNMSTLKVRLGEEGLKVYMKKYYDGTKTSPPPVNQAPTSAASSAPAAAPAADPASASTPPPVPASAPPPAQNIPSMQDIDPQLFSQFLAFQSFMKMQNQAQFQTAPAPQQAS